VQHIEHAPVHCDDSDEEADANDDPSIPSQEWEEEMGQLEYPDEQPPQSDDDSDDSWEAFDDYDFEDAEELQNVEVSSTRHIPSMHLADSTFRCLIG
jgi:hypothetical protein